MTSNQDGPVIHVAPAPHLSQSDMSTRKMMIDVLISLVPLMAMAVWLFRLSAVKQMMICLLTCLAAEWLFSRMRGRGSSIKDFSAAVTAMILALSLPGTAPWYIGVIASVVAIGIGKMIFGGIGMNIFNPAMVGRAFVMISFAGSMGASAYVASIGSVDAVSQATPLTALKQDGIMTPALNLLSGLTNGSLGETSVIACLLGGVFLCYRKSASWIIPVSILGTVGVMAGIHDLATCSNGVFFYHYLFGGALFFGAFFIATDPVSSPFTSRGKLIYGIGIGILVMVIRLFSGYPEGVMFAVLLMNAVTPLINRWSIPVPTGDN